MDYYTKCFRSINKKLNLAYLFNIKYLSLLLTYYADIHLDIHLCNSDP